MLAKSLYRLDETTLLYFLNKVEDVPYSLTFGAEALEPYLSVFLVEIK